MQPPTPEVAMQGELIADPTFQNMRHVLRRMEVSEVE